MPKVLAPGQPYAGRASGVVPLNLSIDRDAVVLLRQLAPTAKGHGRFVSRLIFEYAERKALRDKITGALAGEGPSVED
jgi:hypothetical protein